MRKAIVTGAGGFIGHHLTGFLKSKGQHAIGIDIKKPEFEASVADRFVIHDLREKRDALVKLFKGVDDVWALAADMGGIGFITKYNGPIMSGNVTIDINTLEAARMAGVKRYLFTSSACIYPSRLLERSDGAFLSEEMAYPADPQNGYGWEKIYTEKMCHYYHDEHGMDIRIARLNNTYGPRGAWRGGKEKAPAAICRKVAEAVRDGKDHIEIWGSGKQMRSFCYIDDCIKGLDLIMESGYAGPLNLGSDEEVSIDRLADIVMKAAGVRLGKVYVEGPLGAIRRHADNTLCKKITGWAPKIGLEEGVKYNYKWIKEQIGI